MTDNPVYTHTRHEVLLDGYRCELRDVRAELLAAIDDRDAYREIVLAAFDLIRQLTGERDLVRQQLRQLREVRRVEARAAA